MPHCYGVMIHSRDSDGVITHLAHSIARKFQPNLRKIILQMFEHHPVEMQVIDFSRKLIISNLKQIFLFQKLL